MTLRLDDDTRERLQHVVQGRYRSNNAAIVDAINRLWDAVRAEELDAGYAAAVADNPAYPYESEDERQAARTRRNARQRGAE
jgi:predicted transcriptional regulator